MNTPPNCPAGHGPMVYVIITQGDSKDWHDDRVLGCAWFCPLDGGNDAERFAMVLGSVAGKHLTYNQLIAKETFKQLNFLKKVN